MEVTGGLRKLLGLKVDEMINDSWAVDDLIHDLIHPSRCHSYAMPKQLTVEGCKAYCSWSTQKGYRLYVADAVRKRAGSLSAMDMVAGMGSC